MLTGLFGCIWKIKSCPTWACTLKIDLCLSSYTVWMHAYLNYTSIPLISECHWNSMYTLHSIMHIACHGLYINYFIPGHYTVWNKPCWNLDFSNLFKVCSRNWGFKKSGICCLTVVSNFQPCTEILGTFRSEYKTKYKYDFEFKYIYVLRAVTPASCWPVEKESVGVKCDNRKH